MHLTKPFSKMLTNFRKLGELNVFTEVRGNLYIHKGRFSRTTEHDVPHVLLKNKKEIILLSMVAEKYSLSKNSSMSKYTVVYLKLSKV